MKEMFNAWATEVGVPTQESWTVEQICDALVEANAKWPAELTNEQGWQLWTAVMRRELAVQSIQWDELSEGGQESSLEITFRLHDKREYKTTISKESLRTTDFGGICRTLELRVREWKAVDDREREESMRKLDETWAARAPDIIEYVIGFRAWNLSGARLKPIGAGNDVWEGGREVRATCGNGALHRAPDAECECGLYAWNDFEPMKAEARGGVQGKVWGAVKSCGRMQVHPTGFRAEFMQPILLGYDDSEDEMTVGAGGVPELKRGPDFDRVTEIATLLGGIPVVPFDILPEAAREFGKLVGDAPELLP